MINILDIFLLKSEETAPLRYTLKNLRFSHKPINMVDSLKNVESKENNEKKKKNMFEILFSTWCLNPISCINLCFLCEYYELSFHIIQKM